MRTHHTPGTKGTGVLTSEGGAALGGWAATEPPKSGRSPEANPGSPAHGARLYPHGEHAGQATPEKIGSERFFSFDVSGAQPGRQAIAVGGPVPQLSAALEARPVVGAIRLLS